MGNKIGWIIAGVLLVVVTAVFLFKIVIPSPEEPDYEMMRPGMMDLFIPKTPITKFLDVNPAGDGNAADDYNKAIAFWRANREEFKEINRILNQPEARLSPAKVELCRNVLRILEPAKNKKAFSYTFVFTPKELKISSFADGAENLLETARVLQCLVDHYERAGDNNNLRDAATAMFLFGWHLMNERARGEIGKNGMEMQDFAGRKLLACYQASNDAAKCEALEDYLHELGDAQSRFSEKQRIIWRIHPEAGNVFQIMENDQDRTWRIEGTLSLGSMKFTQKNHRGNMRKIRQLLRQARESDDEILREAGRVADECTFDQVQNASQGQ